MLGVVVKQQAWLGRRFAAMFYDLWIVLALWMVVGALCLLLTGGHMDVRDPPWWQRVALLAVAVGYFLVSWCRGGQTIGMRAWRLRLRDADGGPIPFGRAVLRLPLALLSLALAGCGFWWAWLDADRRTAHDRLCRSRMEKLARR